MITITKSDFEGIADIAVHCNKKILDQAIDEAIHNDLKPLLCDLFYPVFEGWDSADQSASDDRISELIYETEFENCNENLVKHRGLKLMLLYYIYARYVYLNGIQDTATGLVKKNRDFSIPVSEADLSSIATRYRNLGYNEWKQIHLFICKQGDSVYDEFDFSNCESGCACGDCGGGTRSGSKRFKGRTISRS